MTTLMKHHSRGFVLTSLLVWVFLIGALATYFMPVFSVKVSPLVKKSWSASSFVGVIPQSVFQGGKGEKPKSEGPRVDVDFKKILEKIAPSQKGDGGKSPLPPLPVIVGVLIPVALVLSYAAVAGAIVLACIPVLKKILLPWVLGLGVLLSGYVMGGVYYLDHVAQKGLGGGEGLLGVIGKALSAEIAFQPEPALFALIACLVLAYIVKTTLK